MYFTLKYIVSTFMGLLITVIAFNVQFSPSNSLITVSPGCYPVCNMTKKSTKLSNKGAYMFIYVYFYILYDELVINISLKY